MGLFDKKSQDQPQQPSMADMVKMAMQMQTDMLQQQSAMADATAGTTVGTMTWARKVMGLLSPPQPGFVKRCSCGICGAPKKLPTTQAYVYCDYCGALADFDLRRACESDTMPGPEYMRLVNGAQAQVGAAQAAGDREGYKALQRQIFDAYVTHVPNAVSHRARNDASYRAAYINYMAESATVRAFDDEAVRLEAEMRDRVMGLRYSGSMMAQQGELETFWPMVDTLERQLVVFNALNKSSGVAEMDPDRAQHLTSKMAWSGFAQGWLPMLPDDGAQQLLARAGLTNEYVAVQVEEGQPRKCGGCGGEIHALDGAKAVVCDGCGRTLDVGAAEIPCVNCGAHMTLPAGAERTTCPFCSVNVEKVGIL